MLQVYTLVSAKNLAEFAKIEVQKFPINVFQKISKIKYMLNFLGMKLRPI